MEGLVYSSFIISSGLPLTPTTQHFLSQASAFNLVNTSGSVVSEMIAWALDKLRVFS